MKPEKKGTPAPEAVPAPIETAPAPVPAPEKTEPTLHELEQAVIDANVALQTAIATGNYVEIGKCSNGIQSAIKAVNAFNAKLEAGKAEKEAAEKREASISFLVEKLGISRETFNALLDADKADANQPLRNAFHAVFGGKVVVAKDGQSGKSLTGENGATRGGKSTEIENLLLGGGVTKADLLAAYPTDGNPDKLNGTARTVLSLNGWKLNPAGVYEKK